MDWKKVISSVAPTLGTALGGPLGGVAVTGILSALGIEGSTDPEQNEKLLEEKMKLASPADLVTLKEAEYQFKKDMKKMGVDIEAIHAKDRDSARKREVKIGGYTTPLIAVIVVVGFFGMAAAVLLGVTDAMTTTAVGFAGTVVGYASAKADQVISYYFGSSSGQDYATQNKR